MRAHAPYYQIHPALLDRFPALRPAHVHGLTLWVYSTLLAHGVPERLAMTATSASQPRCFIACTDRMLYSTTIHGSRAKEGGQSPTAWCNLSLFTKPGPFPLKENRRLCTGIRTIQEKEPQALP